MAVGDTMIMIVGVGDDGQDGLTQHARQLIESATVMLGPQPLLDKIQIGPSRRIAASMDLAGLRQQLAEQESERVVLLAGGDPLFYGIARHLCDALGKERFEVVPHVSSMQLAFARVKESWDDAYLTNLATQPLDRVVERTRTAERVGLFTTESLSPSAVAEALLDRRIDYFQAYVCENLGSPDERVTQGSLEEIRGMTFGPLNVMILVRRTGAADQVSRAEHRRLFGNPDDAFQQSRPKRGLLTPMEVRTVALADMDIEPTSIVWDVGAGSGSVAIEAAQIASGGEVYAIEMDAEDYGLMLDNAQQFDCPSLVPIHGQAPEAFAQLPDPDAVFLGGTGRAVNELAAVVWQRLKSGGRMVVNLGSPEPLGELHQMLRELDAEAHVRMINVAHGTYQMDRLRFEAANPTFLISARKG